MSAACNYTLAILYDPELCTLETCCWAQATVSYSVNVPGNVIYMLIFLVLLGCQIFFGIRYRTWGFLVGMIGGLFLEVLGYIGRIMIHGSPFAQNPFLLYLICLTIGPAFLTASIYLCLARFVTAYGSFYSRLSPRMYTIIFITADFFALLLQAIGGAIASTATTNSSSNMGRKIMVAGLAWQVISLIVFMVLCVEFTLRVRRSSESANPDFERVRSAFKFKAFVGAVGVATVTIFTRCVYRVAELQSGFNGPVANNQTLFMILEGPMIIIAVGGLTLFHPGYAFDGMWAAAGWGFKKGHRNMPRSVSDPNESPSKVEMDNIY